MIDSPSGIPEVLAAELEPLGIPVFQGPVWTTDAPYRETHEQLTHHARSGVLAVEMQAASLFAFAAARGISVGLVAHLTNAIDHAGEPFDKGPQSEGYRLLRAICRAGRRLIEK
jgi:uridine phosphorylase